MIYGAGASNCTTWMLERRRILVSGTPSVLGWEQMGWVLGYMTAYSQHAPAAAGDSQLPNGITIAAGLDVYCAEYPEVLLFAATSAVVQRAVQRPLEAVQRPIETARPTQATRR